MAIKDIDRGMENIKRELEKARHSSVKVGVLEGTAPHKSSHIDMVRLAAVHEFGMDVPHPGGTLYGFNNMGPGMGSFRFLPNNTDGVVLGRTRAHIIPIPERSFIRATVDENKELITDLQVKILDGILRGRASTQKGLSLLGQKVENLIKKRMADGIDPPNARSTVMKKTKGEGGVTKPLIDTGNLRQSIRYMVNEKASA